MSAVEFNDDSISCEPESGSTGWKIGIVTILDRDSNPIKTQWPASFLNLSYEARDTAYDAGIRASKNWIQGLHSYEEFV